MARAVSVSEKLAVGSVAVAVVVLALKAAAWWVTDSAALYADAAESVVNVVASSAALAAVRLAAEPADANHPYGHGKAEFLAAVLVGALIVAAAVTILYESYFAWREARLAQAAPLGLAVAGVATVLNGGWAAHLGRRARALRSPALAADATHLWSDVVTSLGAMAGLALAYGTGLSWLDPLAAALTAVNILWSGWRLLRGSIGGLMDEAAEPDLIARIRAIVSQEATGALEAHDLRTRRAGRYTFLEFHLVVPAAMTVADAHDICDRIEAALRAEDDGLRVTIHVEPEGKAKHVGVVVV